MEKTFGKQVYESIEPGALYSEEEEKTGPDVMTLVFAALIGTAILLFAWNSLRGTPQSSDIGGPADAVAQPETPQLRRLSD